MEQIFSAAYGVPYATARGCTLEETCSSWRAHIGADFLEGAAAPTMEQFVFKGRTLGERLLLEQQESVRKKKQQRGAVMHRLQSPILHPPVLLEVGESRRVRRLRRKELKLNLGRRSGVDRKVLWFYLSFSLPYFSSFFFFKG